MKRSSATRRAFVTICARRAPARLHTLDGCLAGVLSVLLVEDAGLYDTKANEIAKPQVLDAARKLQRIITATLPPDSGHAITVKPITLDGISAGEYLSLEAWLWADTIDPLET